jgi:cob(I)alamin adenosyltransferase
VWIGTLSSIMVKLTKIYTRTGDSGTTGLGTGERVPKGDLRVASYGSVDETNAVVGVAVTHAEVDSAMWKRLRAIQHDLFDLGADLCTPIKPDEDPAMVLRITQGQVDALEVAIDGWNKDLEALTSFVLPGGTALAAALHVARTVCRRAEREVAELLLKEPERTSGLTMTYLNRLSDLLFVMGRVANDPEMGGGSGDVLWVPGKNREDAGNA